MMLPIGESVFSPEVILWLTGTVFAIGLIYSAINRRSTGLIEVLRSFVSRSKESNSTDSEDSE